MVDEMLIDVDIPIDIEGAYDPDGLPKVVAKKTTPAVVVKPEDLKRVEEDRDAERAARTAAEKAAAEAAAAARNAMGRLSEVSVQAYGAHYANVSSQLQRVTEAISTTKVLADRAGDALAAAERDLASIDPADPNAPALRAQLADRKVQAQRELSRVEAELVTLEAGKHSAEAAAHEAKRYWEAAAQDADATTRAVAEAAAKEQQQSKTQTADQWIDQCPAATRPWLREHREFTTDPVKHRKLLRFAEEYAEDHGGVAALDTADYVAAMNAKFFPKQQDEDVGDGDNEPPAEPRRHSAPAAPPSRSSSPAGGGGGGGSGSRIRLSADEVSVAVQMYPDLQRQDALKKYATNKARAIREGLYAPRQ